ncbi:unnamed protein product, partial [Prorocentrum cordatum]
TGEEKYLVRGTSGAPYHKDVAAPYLRQYSGLGLDVKILGGGRIRGREGSADIRVLLRLSLGGRRRARDLRRRVPEGVPGVPGRVVQRGVL